MNRPSFKFLAIPLGLTVAVALLWGFPGFWYREQNSEAAAWFREQPEVAGWAFRAIPVGESAERLLVADRTVNGEFKNSQGAQVSVFSAKRYEEKSNEIGLFIHTPDRCWVDAGWKLEKATGATWKEIPLHGIQIPVERRIFDFDNHRELVYFFGLINGSPVPYRLDHYLSTGLRSANAEAGGREFVRASDAHFWARLWESFTRRHALLGPKQFVRISTSLGAEEAGAADKRLENFLAQWLVPTDFNTEKANWKLLASAPPPGVSD